MRRLVSLFLVLTAACTSSPTAIVDRQPTASAVLATGDTSAYPVQVSGIPTQFPEGPSSGYPGPQASSGAAEALRTPIPPVAAPTPAEGRASISGVVYSYSVHQVAPKTMFYLTPAVGDDRRMIPPILMGPIASNGDVVGYTDERGQFALNDVLPGNYYLIVSASTDWLPGHKGPDQSDLLFIELKPGDQVALGVVYADWP